MLASLPNAYPSYAVPSASSRSILPSAPLPDETTPRARDSASFESGPGNNALSSAVGRAEQGGTGGPPGWPTRVADADADPDLARGAEVGVEAEGAREGVMEGTIFAADELRLESCWGGAGVVVVVRCAAGDSARLSQESRA